jgi:hypothetical protein
MAALSCLSCACAALSRLCDACREGSAPEWEWDWECEECVEDELAEA